MRNPIEILEDSEIFSDKKQCPLCGFELNIYDRPITNINFYCGDTGRSIIVEEIPSKSYILCSVCDYKGDIQK